MHIGGHWDRTKRKGRFRYAAFLFAVMLFAAFTTGCGSAGSNSADTAASGGSYSGSASSASAQFMSTSSSAGYTGETLALADTGTVPEAGIVPGTATQQAEVRKIIYSADVVMEVEDFGKAQTELDNLVVLSGGYMLHFSDSRNDREIGGNFTIKVPSDGFRSFLKQLETLKKGNEFRRSVRGQDVTEEFVDLSSRLKAKEAVEARLLELMKQATEARDLLEFSNELARVQEDIESYKGKIRYINENVAYSTVSLRMYEVIDDGIRRPGDDSLPARIAGAFVSGGKAVLRFVSDALVILAAALPALVLIAAFGVPVWWFVRRYLKKRAGKASASARGLSGVRPLGEEMPVPESSVLTGSLGTHPTGKPDNDMAGNKAARPGQTAEKPGNPANDPTGEPSDKPQSNPKNDRPDPHNT